MTAAAVKRLFIQAILAQGTITQSRVFTRIEPPDRGLTAGAGGEGLHLDDQFLG
jgi:hypothetical protein